MASGSEDGKYKSYWLGVAASECSLSAIELALLEQSVEHVTGRRKVLHSTTLSEQQFYGIITEGLGRAFLVNSNLEAPVTERVRAETAELVHQCDLGWFGGMLWDFVSAGSDSVAAVDVIGRLAHLASGDDQHWHRFVLQICESAGGQVPHTSVNTALCQLHRLLCESAIWSLNHQKESTTDSELLEHISYCLRAATQLHQTPAPTCSIVGTFSIQQLVQLPNMDGLLHHTRQMLVAIAGGAHSTPEWHVNATAAQPAQSSVAVPPSIPQPTLKSTRFGRAGDLGDMGDFVAVSGWAPGWCGNQRARSIRQPAAPDLSFGLLCDVKHSSNRLLARTNLSTAVEAVSTCCTCSHACARKPIATVNTHVEMCTSSPFTSTYSHLHFVHVLRCRPC